MANVNDYEPIEPQNLNDVKYNDNQLVEIIIQLKNEIDQLNITVNNIKLKNGE